MKKNTALDWANMMDVTVEEFNQNLAELGYQSKDSENQKWLRTPKGIEHSEQFCGRILWDMDAFFDALKLQGKKTGEFFYCEKCGSYNKVEKEEKFNFICKACGYPEVSIKQAKIAQDANVLWWNHIKECVRKEGNITETLYMTWIEPLQHRVIENRIFVEVPYEAVAIQYVRNKYRELFKEVIKRETGKKYIVSFVQPGEILIEDE